VFDVPPKLSARVRVFATGNGRKTDPVDAHAVAVAACGEDLDGSHAIPQTPLVQQGVRADGRRPERREAGGPGGAPGNVN
jgi:transposase